MRTPDLAPEEPPDEAARPRRGGPLGWGFLALFLLKLGACALLFQNLATVLLVWLFCLAPMEALFGGAPQSAKEFESLVGGVLILGLASALLTLLDLAAAVALLAGWRWGWVAAWMGVLAGLPTDGGIVYLLSQEYPDALLELGPFVAVPYLLMLVGLACAPRS